MGIRDKYGGGGGGRSLGAGKNSGVWGAFIVEVDGLVGSFIASIVVNIVGFFILAFPCLSPLTYLRLARHQLQTYFSQKQKQNKVTRWWGAFLMNLSYF